MWYNTLWSQNEKLLATSSEKLSFKSNSSLNSSNTSPSENKLFTDLIIIR